MKPIYTPCEWRESRVAKDGDFVVGIDACRNRSGGAKAHLIGLLSEAKVLKYGIREVHVWTYRALLDLIPDRAWLVKHNPKELQKSLPRQIWWQANRLSRQASEAGCDILFTTDASTLCRFKPMVVLSQDMLSYEPGVMQHFGYGKARLRLLAILLLQNHAFRFADGVVFLTKYAAKVIQQSCGLLPRVAYVPHGISADFRHVQKPQVWPEANERPIQCLYVSNAAMYKHQWVVVEAIAELRKRGHNLTLSLVGGGSGRAQRLLEEQIASCDPDGIFVAQIGFVPKKELPTILANADLFIFASSCENMPNTLIEAMAAGLPIACSNRGPMPEILADGGVYFDPENVDSVAVAVEQLTINQTLRMRVAQRAKELSKQYSWSRCAHETFLFVAETYRSITK